MKLLILVPGLLISMATASAHEGHDKTPGAMSAPHGGMVKSAGHVSLEIVPSKTGFKLYPLDHDKKPIALADIKVEAVAKFPRKKKVEPVVLRGDADFFEGTVASSGAYRYTVEIKATHGGKTEKFSFNVEPM